LSLVSPPTASVLPSGEKPKHMVRPLGSATVVSRQEKLYQRLYAPEAFASRLLGNLKRFHDVKYRPEPVRLSMMATFARLVRHYWRLGKAARLFFWASLQRRSAIRHVVWDKSFSFW
jgi:hypothetical protein